MGRRNQKVDAYIAQAAEFARPILKHLRELVHTGCPEVEETIKWQFPVFLHQGMMCSMAAFQQHCSFGFWKHKLIKGLDSEKPKKTDSAMGQLGRITSLASLPPNKKLISYIKQAARLNEQGVKVSRAARPRGKSTLTIPAVLTIALQRNKKAAGTFASFSPSHQREYVEWIAEAKREETRRKRLETTIAWLVEGKSRNWKYANC